MDQQFGREAPQPHAAGARRKPARWLVLIDSGGSKVARLFGENREQAGEFDAGIEEVALMVQGLVATQGVLGPEWDRALEGHSRAERAAAELYTLDV